jgi:hypothetical protein
MMNFMNRSIPSLELNLLANTLARTLARPGDSGIDAAARLQVPYTSSMSAT